MRYPAAGIFRLRTLHQSQNIYRFSIGKEQLHVIVFHPPIITLKAPNIIWPPWAVWSPILAAGAPPMITDDDPLTMISGGPTQTKLSPTLAAGSFPINTVGSPGPTIGPPTCGIGGTPGVCIGHWWKSVSRAAGGIFFNLSWPWRHLWLILRRPKILLTHSHWHCTLSGHFPWY